MNTPPDNFITEFVGLKAKCYSLLFANEETKIRCKGLNKSGMNAVRHASYLECLREGSAKDTEVRAIRSFSHQLFSVACTKRCLSAFDDKRYILPGGNETWPHFHHDTTPGPCLKMDLTKGKFINVSLWNGNPYCHLVNRNTQTRITLNKEDLNLISEKSKMLKKKPCALMRIWKHLILKRKTVKKTHEPEKHTSVDKKKRKTTYEKENILMRKIIPHHAKVSQITENKRWGESNSCDFDISQWSCYPSLKKKLCTSETFAEGPLLSSVTKVLVQKSR